MPFQFLCIFCVTNRKLFLNYDSSNKQNSFRLHPSPQHPRRAPSCAPSATQNSPQTNRSACTVACTTP